MNKFILFPILIASILQADISNQTSNQKSDLKSERKSEQKSVNQNETKTSQKSRAKENSENKSIARNITSIKSCTNSVTKSKTGTWSININPIPYILMQMRKFGWNKKAFSLKNSDIGTDFFIKSDEKFVDLNAKAYYESKAATRGKMTRKQIKKLEKIIELLYFTGKVADKSAGLMRDFHRADIVNINTLARNAVSKVYNSLKPDKFNIYECSYGGNNDTYNCNDSEFTVILTNSVPMLLKNGIPYYSSTKIGFSTPSLTLSFALNDSDALSKLEQDSNSKSVTKMIRQYTSYLEQKGQSEIASKIKNAMIEKALTSNLSTTASATIQAINSGSPTSVLKIFQ